MVCNRGATLKTIESLHGGGNSENAPGAIIVPVFHPGIGISNYSYTQPGNFFH